MTVILFQSTILQSCNDTNSIDRNNTKPFRTDRLLCIERAYSKRPGAGYLEAGGLTCGLNHFNCGSKILQIKRLIKEHKMLVEDWDDVH